MLPAFLRARSLRACAVVAAGALAVAAAAGPPAAAATVSAQARSGGLHAGPAHRGPLSTGQALARAAATGRAVAVSGATTPTDTLRANPDGTLTLTRSLVPVRTFAGGRWQPLDATLTRDGAAVRPVRTANSLTLSAGGTGPLATLRTPGGQSLSVWLPVTLPVPVLAGATATYPSLAPGVDLQVRVDAQGGFSDVLIVHSAAAAASPLLRRLVLAARAPGLRLRAGRAGNIAADNGGGHPIFTAPTPFMWDSARPAATVRSVISPATGRRVDARSGMPMASSAASPGEAAHTARVGIRIRPGAIALTPDATMLTSARTVFPVYIDPSFTAPSAGSSRNEWTTVNNGFPSQSYWKTSGLLQVGDQAWSSPFFVARSFVNMPIPSKIYGATILSAQLNVTEEWSPSCSARPVQAWNTGAISSSTTWNSQPGWNSDDDSQNVAHGYDSSCPAKGVGFDVKSTIQSAADHKWTQATFGLRAGDESDPYGWKQFSNTATMAITYNHTPNTPTGLSTSPATSCTASTPTVVGDGNVSLYVPVSDPDGGTLGVVIDMWKTSTGAAFTGTPTDPQKLFVTSGSTAVFVAHQVDLEAAAGGAVTEFSWKAQATDYNKTSSWSATCNFKFDPTRPGPPGVTPPASASIGQPAAFTVTPPSGSTTPTDYMYQLNGGTPGTVTATSGNATITVVPTRFTNTLTVTSQSSGGNIGDSASVVFNAAPAATAADADLTGDGAADLLMAGGGGNGLPPGLWLATGEGNGQAEAGLSDVGMNGNGTAGDNSPADFAGAQVITGHFGGSGLQDLMAYYPSGVNAGQANILFGNGDGSAIQAEDSGTEQTISSGVFTDANGDNPLQLANAGNTSGQGYAYPDLIGVSGDPLDGYYLEFYPNNDGLGDYPVADPLATTTPSGGTDWNNWTITTAQLSSGTALYLWDASTGALYLWENLAYDMTAGTLAYTQYTIADGTSATWNKGASLSLRAADINGDGSPDLWAVRPDRVVTAYLATLGSGAATLAVQPAQSLATPAHAWTLNDAASGSVTTAADTAGTPALNAAGSGNAQWNSGDLFSPDVVLDGSGSALATGSAVVNPASDFTVSAWIMPNALGGVAVSQDMTKTASFKIYPDTSTGHWYFCMATSDASTASNDCASGGTAQTGVWTHVTATYQAASGAMNLYGNGALLGTGRHTAVTGTTGGGLQIGDYLSGTSHTGYFNGEIAGLNAYLTTLTAPQVTAADTGAAGTTAQITSGITGKCIDDAAGGTTNGTKVQIWACNTNIQQRWTAELDGTLRTLGECLTNSGGAATNGNPIVLSACVPGSGSQQWHPGASSSLVNPATGKCLDDPSSSSTNGTQLDLYTCNGTAAQQWRAPYGGLDYAGAITSAAASGKCVDDRSSGTTNGNPIQIYTCNGTNAQDWEVYSDGTLRVLGKCMDNTGGSSSNGNPIQLWSCQPGNTNQQWIPGPGGYWVNPGTGKCLDDPSSSTTNSTQLDLYSCNGTKAQVWPLPSTTVPGLVTAVTATPGPGQATVTWGAPLASGGSAISGYTVTASPGGASVTVTGTTATVTGLTSGTSYTFTVTASNAAGTGSTSAPSAAVTAG
jgi:ricin-type beta-trefoil lectin protein/concanavalin A-like lectin/glucanase superfamily protein/fibronectin type III domain protein